MFLRSCVKFLGIDLGAVGVALVDILKIDVMYSRLPFFLLLD